MVLKGIIRVVDGLDDTWARPYTAAAQLRQIVIQISNKAVYNVLTKDVWDWEKAQLTQTELNRVAGIAHTKLRKANNENNMSIKLQLVSLEELPGAARLADIALKNPKTYNDPKSKPQQANGSSRQASFGKQPRHSQSNNAWYYAKDYKTTNPEVRREIDRVLLCLEYPIGRDNAWCKSVMSFIVLQDVWQAEDVSGLKKSLFQSLGLHGNQYAKNNSTC